MHTYGRRYQHLMTDSPSAAATWLEHAVELAQQRWVELERAGRLPAPVAAPGDVPLPERHVLPGPETAVLGG